MTFKHSVNAVPGDKWECTASLPVAFASRVRAGRGTLLPSRGRVAGAHGYLLSQPTPAPRPGAVGLGAVPCDLALRPSPTPRSEACVIAESLKGMPGLFRGFIHLLRSLPPYPSQSWHLSWGRGSSPCEGSCFTLQFSLSFRGRYIAPLTQHMHLLGVEHGSVPCQASSDDSFASATASPLQLQELPQALINLCGCWLCCWGGRSATVVYHSTPHDFVTSQSSAPTVKLLCHRAACCVKTCSVLQYLAGSSSSDSLCVFRL